MPDDWLGDATTDTKERPAPVKMPPPQPTPDIAAAATTPAGQDNFADYFPTKSQMDKAQSDLTRLQEQKITTNNRVQLQQERQDAQDRHMMVQAFNAEGNELHQLKPWDADKEMQKRQTSIWEDWGSPAVFVANLLSAFTGAPMTNALNASAASMNAIQKGEMDNYNRAFDAWKNNTDLTLKRANLEHQMYQEIDSLRSRDMESWRAKAAAIASRFQDERGLALLRNGMDPEFLQVKEAIPTAMAKMAEAQSVIQDNNLKIKWLNADPRWKSGDPRQMKAALDDYSSPDNSPAQYAFKKANEESYKEKGRGLNSQETLDFMKQSALATRAGLLTGATLTAQDVPAIKEDLKNTLGHPLSTGLNSAIDAAFSAKGQNAPRIVAAANRAIEGIRADLAAGKSEAEINPEERLNQAIVSAAAPGGRSGATAFINKYQIEHPDATSDEVNRAAALFTKTQAFARTLGGRSANVDTAVVEAKKAAQLALKASDSIPRGNWVPITKIQQAISRQTSSPAQQKFDTYNTSLITAYAQTMSRSGTNTVTAMRRAEDVLSTATGPEAYREGVQALMNEMSIVQDAVREVSDEDIGTEDKDRVKSPGDKSSDQSDPLGIR